MSSFFARAVSVGPLIAFFAAACGPVDDEPQDTGRELRTEGRALCDGAPATVRFVHEPGAAPKIGTCVRLERSADGWVGALDGGGRVTLVSPGPARRAGVLACEAFIPFSAFAAAPAGHTETSAPDPDPDPAAPDPDPDPAAPDPDPDPAAPDPIGGRAHPDPA